MPGDNCLVFGCGTCRRTKGIGICKTALCTKCRIQEVARRLTEWDHENKSYWQRFPKQNDSDKVFICEKHFKPEDVELCEYCSCHVGFLGCQHQLTSCQLSLVCLNFLTLLWLWVTMSFFLLLFQFIRKRWWKRNQSSEPCRRWTFRREVMMQQNQLRISRDPW